MSSIITIAIAASTLLIGYFIREYPELPSEVGYFPDMVIALASVFIFGHIIATRAWARIPVRYVLTFLGFLYVVLAGLVVNGVSGDTAFAGIRSYFKYVPVFLIPFAFRESDRAFRGILLVVAGILILQIPVTVWQRFFEFYASKSGDEIRGTLSTTSSVAVVASGAILFCAALFIDGRIRVGVALALAVAFLIPAGLSETKVTPILLAAGGVALLIARRSQLGARLLSQLVLSGAIIIGAFVVLYNELYSGETQRTYFEKLAPKSSLENYNLTGVGAAEFKISRDRVYGIVGVERQLRDDVDKEVGRLDSVRMPFDALLGNETVRLLVGLGIGNVDSDFGSGGDYRDVKRELGAAATTISILIWETGVLGAFLFIVLILLVGKDAWHLSQAGGFFGTIGLAVLGIVVVWLISLLYANLFHQPEVLILGFYLAGSIVSRLEETKRILMSAPSTTYINTQQATARPGR